MPHCVHNRLVTDYRLPVGFKQQLLLLATEQALATVENRLCSHKRNSRDKAQADKATLASNCLLGKNPVCAELSSLDFG